MATSSDVFRGLAAAIIVGVFVLNGCSSGKAPVHICTDLICHDEFVATIDISAGSAPAGTHVVNITADADVSSCTFEFPPDPAGAAGAVCSGMATLVVQSVSSCQTTATDATLGERCDAAPGQYSELIVVKGKPQSIRIQQTANGAVVFDHTATPSYHENQPNGPDCPPSCQQAAKQWTI